MRILAMFSAAFAAAAALCAYALPAAWGWLPGLCLAALAAALLLLHGDPVRRVRNAPEDAALGDRVRVTADVTETGNSLYLASNDILLLGFVRGEAEWEHPEQVSLRYAPQRALLAVQRTITNCFPADAAPLANALVTGDTSGLP